MMKINYSELKNLIIVGDKMVYSPRTKRFYRTKEDLKQFPDKVTLLPLTPIKPKTFFGR